MPLRSTPAPATPAAALARGVPNASVAPPQAWGEMNVSAKEAPLIASAHRPSRLPSLRSIDLLQQAARSAAQRQLLLLVAFGALAICAPSFEIGLASQIPLPDGLLLLSLRSSRRPLDICGLRGDS